MNPNSDHPALRFEMNRTYEPYSNDPDYIQGNRDFIHSLDLNSPQRVLDLACGIGTLSDLMKEARPEIAVLGLDLSHEALCIVHERRRTSAAAGNGEVTRWPGRSAAWLLAASADSIPLGDDSVDAVVMGHAIHMLPDEHQLLAEIARVLRPGGWFAFNTSFYAGTFVPGTEHIYHDWVKQALSYILDKDRKMKAQGLPGIKRTRGKVPPAFSKAWPSPEDWNRWLGEHGLRPERQFIRTVPLTVYSFEAIGAYAGFSSVMISGYPVEIACEALQVASSPTLAAAGVDRVPRNWLEVVAKKT
jgi:ubiquinone/menaquinone biosynthesis C-methylase UbiE